MHMAAETGSMAACEVILKLRPDAIHDTDKKVKQMLLNIVVQCHLWLTKLCVWVLKVIASCIMADDSFDQDITHSERP